MDRHHNIKLFSFLGLLFLAGCGGGSSSGGASAPPTENTSVTLAPATALADGSTVGTSQWSDGDTASGGTGAPVGTLTCGPTAASYSYAHLSIIANGTQVALPANIGSVAATAAQQAGCSYPVRTDDASGKIRFNASGAYTLGQFFSVWGQPLTTTNVGGVTGPVTAYIKQGSTVGKYTGDLASLPLTPHSEITLVVGATPAQVPTYTWTDPPALDNAPITQNAADTTNKYNWPNADTPTGGNGQTVDGLACEVGMSEDFHVHAHVAIFEDGVPLTFPANIGIPATATNGCNYAVHTHDNTGQIHIEAPAPGHFTVGTLFDIWGRPLSATNVAGITGKPVTIYINDGGDVRQYIGDPANIEMISHRVITFQIGTPLTSIPTYNWDSPK